jgi:uncharacterized protein YbbC (DUF1343 family)
MPILTRAQACSLFVGACATPFLPCAATAAPFELGCDRFIESAWMELRGKRLGLVTNQTGLLSSGESLIDALTRNPAIRLHALFSPEHGLRGTHGAGLTVRDGKDAATGLPIYSLYGKTRQPTPAMLAGIDVLIFDIQDVGARTYTFISTLALVMQAAAALGKSVWVLDRPNPIGGRIVEGPVLEPAFSSFIGLYPLPMRHGMTIGEIARLYRARFGIACDLRVIPMRNYARSMLWSDTGLRWIPTSPHMPHLSTALVYLSTGPLGAAGINNGVASSTPFELALAPELDGNALAATLNARSLEGIHFTPASWTPQSGYWRGKELTGVRLNVTEVHRFYSVRTAVEILSAVRSIAPRTLRYSSGWDKVWGTDSLRIMLQRGVAPEAMLAHWQPRLKTFITEREGALLYG